MKKYNSNGERTFTLTQARKIAESLIPEKLRPYIIDLYIDKMESDEPYTASNTRVDYDFKYPVRTYCDGTRWVLTTLDGARNDLLECELDPDNTEDYEDWDKETKDKPTLPTKAYKISFDWQEVIK